MNTGVSTFTWTSPFRTEAIDLIPKAKKIGFDVFEMAAEEPELIDLDAVRRALEENEMGATICPAVGPGRDLSSDDKQVRDSTMSYLKWCVDAAEEINAPLIVGALYSSVGKRRACPPDERLAERKRAAEGLRELGTYAGDRGIRLALEPINRFEIDMINTVDQSLELLSMIDSPHVGLLLDSFHMNIEEKDTKEAIIRAGDKLFHFHSNESDRGVPGTGQVDWQGVKEGLQEINYRGSLVIEAFTTELEVLAAAVCLWRPVAPDQDTIAIEGLRFLRSFFELS